MIKDILIKGERCSGTNYLWHLIKDNFNIKSPSLLGWKHAYVNPFNKELFNHEHYLVIFIFRNPVSWVKSLHKNPWHFANERQIKENDIKKFLTVQQPQIVRGFSEFKSYNPMTELYWERHPFTLEIPQNICQLRNWKNENFLSAAKILSNVEYVCYETLAANPKAYLDYLNEKYLRLSYSFTDILHYKGAANQGLYAKKNYNILSEDNLSFISDNLNWSLEKEIGYTKNDLYIYNEYN